MIRVFWLVSVFLTALLLASSRSLGNIHVLYVNCSGSQHDTFPSGSNVSFSVDGCTGSIVVYGDLATDDVGPITIGGTFSPSSGMGMSISGARDLGGVTVTNSTVRSRIRLIVDLGGDLTGAIDVGAK
jgi:hypothetical protein